MPKAEPSNLKHKIVEAAREVLISEGYRNLSLRKIAGSIDVSATSIYLYFENKDDLVHTLIGESIERLNRQLEVAAEEPGDPIAKLELLARAYVRFGMEHPREYQIIYLVSSDEMARYPKKKFREARKGYEIVINVLEEREEAGLTEGHKPRIAAYTFWAQLHGVMSVVLSKRLDTRIEQSEFMEEAIEHIINGYRFKKPMEKL